jgi:Thermolysin metallopeptidase, alpha-helical domain/Thermolysin metallopeptidase, catalytic domain
VNEAYEDAEKTYEFFLDVFDRDSIDGAGLEIVSAVRYGIEYDNAAWTAAQMIYGDGGGGMFLPGGMTRDDAVIAHELAHGITDFTANLRYSKQPGALNESFSEVFGSLVKQHGLGQTADQADWLVGEGILAPELGGEALRSLKAPGTAHRFANQPDSMAGSWTCRTTTTRATTTAGCTSTPASRTAPSTSRPRPSAERLGEAGADLVRDPHAAPVRQLPVPRGGYLKTLPGSREEIVPVGAPPTR